MNVSFDHLSLSAINPQRMKDFLCDLLGFEVGSRPGLPFDGYFLYAGDKDVVHIFPHRASHEQQQSEVSGVTEQNIVHHVSFYSDDFDEVMVRIATLNLNYSMNTVPDSSVKQIFVRAPENLIIEIQGVPKGL
ncbi:VOC family protein [Neptunomonas antarctica]|uniref:VOC domain-containing protein n=1 Tax=Neptunomonas antarctica TaxID=619304 RepID=A0A1N7L7C4_9GAMM|nr:VOC family protein [Neptunomonas antarctica]SIS69580.1 hypothetical protein SAMN05421760_103280 [Neptunomonas antarctica]